MKIKVIGNSMAGLFLNGKVFKVHINSADFDLEIGRVIILKKEGIQGYSFRQAKSAFRAGEKEGRKIPELMEHFLLIHRIVAKFNLQGRLCLWEKGDNDRFPKACKLENVLGIVTDIEDHPELITKLQPDLWRKRNRKLLKFYNIVGKIFVVIEGREGNKRRGLLQKIQQKGFWSIFYFVCSLFDLKGK